MTKILYLTILAGLSFFAIRCEKEKPQAGFYSADVISISQFVLDSTNNFKKFAKILETANMVDALASYNPAGNNFTLFLPTDEAVDQFIEDNNDFDDFDELLADKDYVTSLARYHVVMLELKTNDFPYGALPDTTATGDYLTIGIDISGDSSIYRVNNVAPIIQPNIELINGTVHVISKMLEPVVMSSYDWLIKHKGFSILTEALEITGLKDTMGIYSHTPDGKTIENVYTMLVEHDSIYHKRGIYTIEDLIDTIVGDPGRNNYTEPDNPLYQFAAYHIMENRYFLDALESSVYNTYANFPVNIISDIELMVNKGSRVYDTIINYPDTTIIDYISILVEKSNVLTKNGAIHFINEMLELYKPGIDRVTFQFTNEEPILDQIRNEVGEHYFYSDDEFTAIKWEGVKELVYIKSASASEKAWDNDYIRLDGDFKITYKIPKVLAGTYDVMINANASSNKNATILVYIDGKRIGSSFDLSTGGNPYLFFKAGKITFLTSEEHVVEIRALVPGVFEWDVIQFRPSV